MTGTLGRHAYRVIILALGCAWALLWIRRIVWTNYLVLATTIQDDSYYYLLPAWNRAHLGWFTFDGLTRTYGFQPLWEIGLAVLAVFTPSRSIFLRAALLGQVFLFAATAVLAGLVARAAWRRVHASGGHAAAIVATTAWLLNIRMGTAFTTVKENAIYACVFAALVLLGSRDTAPGVRGAVAGLALLARLSPMSIAAVGAQTMLVGDPRRVFRYLGTTAVVLGLWAAYAAFTFGHVVPTSGAVKMDGFWADVATWPRDIRAIAGGIVAYVAAAIRFSLGFTSRLWPAPDQDALFRWLSALFAACGVIWAARHRSRPLLVTTTAVLIGLVSMPILLHARMTEIYYYAWYVVELPVLAAVFAGLGGEALLHAAAARSRMLAVAVLAIVVAVGARSAWQLERVVRPVHAYVDRGEWQQATVSAANWINAHAPLGGAGVASFSAGILGWFADVPVVNLDGLANDEVVAASARGVTYEAYCRQRGLRYYVDPSPPRDSYNRFTIVKTFPIRNSADFPTLYVATLDAPSGAQAGEQRGEVGR